MKIRSRFLKREKNFAERKTIRIKCLAKDIKLSSFLGGKPRKFKFS